MGAVVDTTPAVRVGAGRIGGQAASLPWRAGLAGRSVLLIYAVAFSLVVSLAAWLVVGPEATQAAKPVNSLGLRAEYDIAAAINWQQGKVTVTSVAHIRNTRDSNVGKLAFNLLPLKLGHITDLTASVGKNPVTPTVSDQTVLITLPTALGPTEEVNVTIGYRATFNTNTGGKKALFMKKNGIAAAYRWIPWLSRQQRYSTPNFGETWVTANSPRVTVTLTSDAGLVYATSGKRVATNGNSQTFKAHNVRDFNFAASPNYKIKKTTWNGIRLRVLYKVSNPSALMSWSLKALKRFSNRVGKYPYDHLDVAETPAGAGMESPGMTWVDATLAKSHFAYIVVHEMSHQWFYGAVGNNQATQPFLDEAVGDFLTRDMLGSFRQPSCAKARLDLRVYDYSARCYNEVVYVQGGLYLRNYRNQVGDNKFWAGLRNYFLARKFELGNTREFLDTLDAASGYKSQNHANRFPSLYNEGGQ